MPNSQPATPAPVPEDLYEAGPVICRRCRREIEPFRIISLSGVRYLRCGTALIQETTLNCIYCGWEFQWRPDRRRHHAETSRRFGELAAGGLSEHAKMISS